ncbi:uncharacterized protein LOC111328359 [Stylophora pistillata]|uniref:uncharacterized protein LOC111328359 n=1 Tax=Stylophora pistillata TaxID=50429 RepID=UPI000C04DBB2|nr:uncharacterized protein LOC111328359 [Stylophora pistillata]
MTGYKIGLLLTALFYSFVGASITTGDSDNSTTTVARQFILPPRIHQISPFAGTTSATDPSLLAFHGIPASSEVTSEQVENQIAHLNELTQQLRGMPQSPSITQAGKGLPIPLSRYASQIERGASENSVSRPLGVEPSYYKNIAGNPLTGPNGLTKDVLSDLMFGNLKSLASVGGLTTNSPLEENTLSPQMIGNSELRRFNNPLLEEKLANSQSGKSGLGLPLPPNENMDFNDLPNSDLDNINKSPYLQSRHHAKSKKKKKDNKSDVVTKLLLSLLVDKLKDIYEMDRINSSQRKTVTLKLDSSTVGKIENTLKEHGHSSDQNKLSSGRDVSKDTKTSGNFETNLSFPLTFSDTKGTQLSLVDSPKNAKDDSSLPDADTKNIENIIKGIENGSKKSNETRRIRIDSGNSPQEISQKTTKALSPDKYRLQTGSTSEFHRVKMEPTGELGKTATIPSISDYHPTLEVSKANPPSEQMFEVHTDKATISALPTFSISTLLNQEIPGNVKGSNRVINVEKENESGRFTGSNSATIPVTTTETEEHNRVTTSANENDAANYLEASRVLGAVFNKVKDPLARKSVEVAIKAMLKLMKSDKTYSKKESVPSSKSSVILQEKVKKLMKTIDELSRMVHVEDESPRKKHKKYSHVKRKLFRKRFSYKRIIHHRSRVGMDHLKRTH